jgi:hypothetical protein
MRVSNRFSGRRKTFFFGRIVCFASEASRKLQEVVALHSTTTKKSWCGANVRTVLPDDLFSNKNANLVEFWSASQ